MKASASRPVRHAQCRKYLPLFRVTAPFLCHPRGDVEPKDLSQEID
jgi:hypothetical protein